MTAVAEVLDAIRPLLGEHAVDAAPPPRFEGPPERAFVLEAVLEGYLLHYGEPRLVRGADEDLALLAGDALYALGVERLALAGDVPAVAELADLIAICAWAHSEGRPQAAEVAWAASAELLLRGAGGGARAAVAGASGASPP